MRVVGTTTRAGASSTPSRRRKSRSAAVRPSVAESCEITVMPSRSASSMSSKPTRATGCSRPARARTAVTVTRLLPAKIAVTGSGPLSIDSAAARTRSGSVEPSATHASATGSPASSIAAR